MKPHDLPAVFIAPQHYFDLCRAAFKVGVGNIVTPSPIELRAWINTCTHPTYRLVQFLQFPKL